MHGISSGCWVCCGCWVLKYPMGGGLDFGGFLGLRALGSGIVGQREGVGVVGNSTAFLIWLDCSSYCDLFLDHFLNGGSCLVM